MARKTLDELMLQYEQMSVYEKAAFDSGITAVAGVDEVGRGPLAGPVVTAAVILDPNKPIYGVNDSKKLSEKARARLKLEIEEKALAISIGIVDVETIDRINILQATKLAMKKAVMGLKTEPQLLLIDAVQLEDVPILQKSIIKGDANSVSIAAASIIAKETRDAMMREYDAIYPEYGFAQHKGYGTKAHMEAILQYGMLPIHRRSFLKKLYDQSETGRI